MSHNISPQKRAKAQNNLTLPNLQFSCYSFSLSIIYWASIRVPIYEDDYDRGYRPRVFVREYLKKMIDHHDHDHGDIHAFLPPAPWGWEVYKPHC